MQKNMVRNIDKMSRGGGKMTFDNIDQGAFLPNSGFPDWREIMLREYVANLIRSPESSGNTGLTINPHGGTHA